MSAAAASDDGPEIRRLTFDLDVEICVIGGGLAGLSVALEAAKMGASVALLEAKRLGRGASGRHLGLVRPGFDVSAQTVIARIGSRAAGELWRMSQTGAEIVRVLASGMAAVMQSPGALDVSTGVHGDRTLDATLSLGTDFAIRAEPWDRQRLRDVLDTTAYFGALHYPDAFQIDGAAYLRGLAAAARAAGVRIFEESPVVGLDATGSRKRIATPQARLRAAHVVLAGNVDLGPVFPRVASTLLPVWRYAAVTAPLGERLSRIVDFAGSVADTDTIDHFRIAPGDRLMWSSPETTWAGRPERYAARIRRRIQRVFPALGPVTIESCFGAAVGRTVHGMPQIGQMRPGLWIASGFGRQGVSTTAMAGRVIAQGILFKDDRWRLFAPFDLIWAGGRTGRVAGYAIEQAARARSNMLAAWSRRNEAAEARSKLREMRIAAVSRLAAKGQVAVRRSIDADHPLPDPAPRMRDPLPPSPFLQVAAPDPQTSAGSQESEHTKSVST